MIQLERISLNCRSSRKLRLSLEAALRGSRVGGRRRLGGPFRFPLEHQHGFYISQSTLLGNIDKHPLAIMVCIRRIVFRLNALGDRPSNALESFAVFCAKDHHNTTSALLGNERAERLPFLMPERLSVFAPSIQPSRGKYGRICVLDEFLKTSPVGYGG